MFIMIWRGGGEPMQIKNWGIDANFKFFCVVFKAFTGYTTIHYLPSYYKLFLELQPMKISLSL